MINYDFPPKTEDYIHRIGRTGRAGAKGIAVTFMSPADGRHARSLTQVIIATAPRRALAHALAPLRPHALALGLSTTPIPTLAPTLAPNLAPPHLPSRPSRSCATPTKSSLPHSRPCLRRAAAAALAAARAAAERAAVATAAAAARAAVATAVAVVAAMAVAVVAATVVAVVAATVAVVAADTDASPGLHSRTAGEVVVLGSTSTRVYAWAWGQCEDVCLPCASPSGARPGRNIGAHMQTHNPPLIHSPSHKGGARSGGVQARLREA